MSDEQQSPAEPVGEDVVTAPDEGAASEATENTEGQVEAPPAEEEAEGTAPAEDSEEPVSKSKARREKRRAQMEQLQREADEASEKYRALKERLQKASESAEGNKPPQEGDFKDYNEYLVALGAYHSTRAIDERTTRELESQAQAQEAEIEKINSQRQAELQENWVSQVNEAKTRYADFDQVVYSTPAFNDQTLIDLVVGSDHAADLAYAIASNPAQAAQLVRLSPLEKARAVGAIEAQLTRPKPNTTTSAPAPISPVKPKGTTGVKDPSKMTMAEYAAARKAGKI